MGPSDEGMHIRVFMLGWEFPPFISGGLGTACYGLTRAMDQLGVKVTFVLPKMVQSEYSTHVKLLTPASRRRQIRRAQKNVTWRNVRFRSIRSPLQAYVTPDAYVETIERTLGLRREIERHVVGRVELRGGSDYSSDLYREVHRYASIAAELAGDEDFDVIHAHDWMTYPAGIAVAEMTGRPLVVHVHSTEFDRSGEHVNQTIYDIEREGMERAEKVLVVSHFTRSIILSRYGIPAEKVEVIYNGVDLNNWNHTPLSDSLKKEYNIKNNYILFIGRPTPQKGLEYLVQARDMIDPDVQIVLGATGADTKEYEDQMTKEVEKKKNMVWIHKLLKEPEYVQLYSGALVFVCPSVYEPFGIINLEAMACNTPVVASAVGGIKEVVMPEVTGLLVEPRDPKQIADAVNRLLKDPATAKKFGDNGRKRVEEKISWTHIAQQTKQVYESLLK